MKRVIKCISLILALVMILGCGQTAEQTTEEVTTEAETTAAAEETTAATEEATTEAPTEAALSGDLLKIHFFSSEVEEWGDCTYIEFPNGENMIIDCGLTAAASGFVESLLDEGIDHINYVILTHSHADHVNGFSNFLANMTIDRVYSLGYWATNFQWVERDIKSMGIESVHVAAGDSFSIGDVTFDILWPTAEDISEPLDVAASGTDGPGGTVNLNGHSMVMKMTYKNNSVMFTADCYKEFQSQIIKMYDADVLKCDILKVPHHGYDNAANADFVEAVSPSYAFAMGNHTMNAKTYNFYTAVGCTTYLSYMNGNAYVEMNGDEIRVTVDNPEILDYYKGGATSDEAEEEN